MGAETQHFFSVWGEREKCVVLLLSGKKDEVLDDKEPIVASLAYTGASLHVLNKSQYVTITSAASFSMYEKDKTTVVPCTVLRN